MFFGESIRVRFLDWQLLMDLLRFKAVEDELGLCYLGARLP